MKTIRILAGPPTTASLLCSLLHEGTRAYTKPGEFRLIHCPSTDDREDTMVKLRLSGFTVEPFENYRDQDADPDPDKAARLAVQTGAVSR